MFDSGTFNLQSATKLVYVMRMLGFQHGVIILNSMFSIITPCFPEVSFLVLFRFLTTTLPLEQPKDITSELT